jgi:RNA polymerase-binding transcription factor DksA
MCVIIRCRICNTIIPTTNLNRKLCDNPDCHHRAAQLTCHNNYLKNIDYNREKNRKRRRFRFCVECGAEIPLGSRKKLLCGKRECYENHRKKLRK